jgi:hypothetical protein
LPAISRDEVFVRVRKTSTTIALDPSSWVVSNAVQVYFGVGESTPENRRVGRVSGWHAACASSTLADGAC